MRTLLVLSWVMFLVGCDCQQQLIDRVGAQDTDLIMRQLLKQSDKAAQWGTCEEQGLPLDVADCQNTTNDVIENITAVVCQTTKVTRTNVIPPYEPAISQTAI